MLIGHFTEQPWQDDSSGLMGTQSTDLSISNEYYNPQVGSKLYNRYLDEKVYAEEMGYDSVWFSEHHFRPVWSHNSAPDLTLAAVSQRTTKIRLGVGVVLAPIHHPLHTAARMATLDILSNGRVDVGRGLGLDPPGRVDNQQRPLTGRQAP